LSTLILAWENTDEAMNGNIVNDNLGGEGMNLIMSFPGISLEKE